MLEALRNEPQVTVVICHPSMMGRASDLSHLEFAYRNRYLQAASSPHKYGIEHQPARQGTGMSSKTANWMIVIGGLMLFLALCFLPAAMHSEPDASLLAAGGAVFSVGVLVIAGAIYIKARAVQSQPSEAAAPKKRVRGGCELCASQEPVIHCRVHQLQLCPACLANHYDFRSCVYVPATRRGTAKGNKAMAAKARGV